VLRNSERRLARLSSVFFSLLVSGCLIGDRPKSETGAVMPAAPEMAIANAARSDEPWTLANGSRFVVPGSWSLQNLSVDTPNDAFVLSAPEQGSSVAIVDGGSTSAEAAVATALAVYMPDFGGHASAVSRPAREGWDETLVYRYESSEREPRRFLVLAQRKSERWTVLVDAVADSVASRRSGELEVIYNSLLPFGYERESFAGRQAHQLDAARIGLLVEYIETARGEFDIPGVALGLIQDGEVVFQGGFGVRELGRPERVDAETLFNIASNGKALTTLMLAKLVEAGRLDWETPVAQIWPAFRLGDPIVTQRVQVDQMICACTGMPRQDYEWLFEGDNSTATSIMQLLGTAEPTTAFGETYQYSNLLAAAAGYLGGHLLHPGLELGDAYDRAMQEQVFIPLGMTATTADFSLALNGNHSAGHAPDIEGTMRVASQGLNFMSISTRPSGNHWSNVSDMLRYVQMELSRGRLPDGTRYIREDVLLKRQEPQVTAGLNEFYGMGLKIDRQWGVTVIHHGGSTPGYRSDMIWLPDHNVGAVILINAYNGAPLRAGFRRRLLEVLFDGEPIAANDLIDDAASARSEIAESRAQLTVPADPKAVQKLAKHYSSPELGNLDVHQESGVVSFEFGGWSSEVATVGSAEGGVTFVTISPGVDGYQFEVSEQDGRRRLVIHEEEREYVFVERDQAPLLQKP